MKPLTETQEAEFLKRIVNARMELKKALAVTEDKAYQADIRMLIAALTDMQDKYSPLPF